MEMPAIKQVHHKGPEANFMQTNQASIDAGIANIPPVSFNLSSGGDNSGEYITANLQQ